MNKHIKYMMLALAVAPALTSCLDEFTPTNGVTQDQVNNADKSGLSSAVSAYMTYVYGIYTYDIGMAACGIYRDAMTCDFPIYDPAYDYYSYVGLTTTLGSTYASQYFFWERYYALIQKTNLVIAAINDDNEEDYVYAADALAYRASTYLDMARWYEYQNTGISALDQEAEAAGVIGLTVPIVTEKTTEAEARNNPRAPFYKMYRFILDDLNRAETYMKGQTALASKSEADLGVIYGLKARLWLYLGTRFDLHPQDLATAISHENDNDIPYTQFGVSDAKECFMNAATYARLAINQGYSPVTETQWFDPTTGFNSVNAAWMWAIIITTDNELATSYTWQSFVSYMCPEATYGVASSDYNAYRMIDVNLFKEIPDADWRKTTWIAPGDVADENAFNTKYARGTSMGFNEWKNYNAYCGMKFHPNGGDRNASTTGNAVSIPLMRVEEMYFIEAEATGRAYGDAAGRQLLETFMNTYRYKDGSYKSTGAGLYGFIDDVFTQKRIEFWGEGLILWDYRRLERQILRGYTGTNWPTLYRYNSLPNAVAPWTTMCLPELERDYNSAILLNPDPSHGPYYSHWEE